MIFRQLWGLSHTKEKSSARSLYRRHGLASLIFWVQLLFHLSQPVLLSMQVLLPAVADLTFTVKIAGWKSPTIFELFAPLYLLLNLPAFFRFGPSFTELLLGNPFLGSGRQLLPPWRTLLVYSAFWVVTLGIKFLFDYGMLIQPLVEPTMKLW